MDKRNSIAPNSFINISFTNSKEIQKLNKKHRGKDYSTDVLSFSINQKLPDGRYYIGDIVINTEILEKQAKEAGHSVEEEVSFLAGHGVLHLLGIHHEGDE